MKEELNDKIKDSIPNAHLFTLQEHTTVGSSLGKDMAVIKGEGDRYTPLGVLKGLYSIDEIAAERETRRYYFNSIIAAALGFQNEVFVFRLAAIDRENGRTAQDPEIIGFWKEGKEEIIPIEEVTDRDINAEYRNILKEVAKNNPDFDCAFREGMDLMVNTGSPERNR